MHARTILALGRGAQPGAGCRCALCGDSPFDSAGPKARVLGPNFVDYTSMVDPSAADVCVGCQGLLGGRPGDDPPPLRTTSLVCPLGGRIEALRARDLWRYLVDPIEGEHVLSWSVANKAHHWLRAGVSTPARLEIGSDRTTIEYVPERDRPLLEAVHALLYSPTGTGSLLSRASISSGDYHPKAVAKFGHARWRDLEAVVARWRPSPLLDLVCAAAPLSTEQPNEEDTEVIDPVDERASTILALIAQASAFRGKDGKQFWGGFFRHRVERFRRQPLATFVSRMLDACQTHPTSIAAGELVLMVRDLSAEEVAQVEQALRDRPALLVALSYDLIQRRRIAE